MAKTELVKGTSTLPVVTTPALRLQPADLELVAHNVRMLTEVMRGALSEEEGDFATKLFPGQKKPSLLDPGASKLRTFFRTYAKHTILARDEVRTEEENRIRYAVETQIIRWEDGAIVASGVGSASSDEVKYKYRWVPEEDLLKTYGYTQEELKEYKSEFRGSPPRKQLYVVNPEIFDLDNTLLKMSAKRSEVDATLQLPGVANVFSQDLGARLKRKPAEAEDMDEPAVVAPSPKPKFPARTGFAPAQAGRSESTPAPLASPAEPVSYKEGDALMVRFIQPVATSIVVGEKVFGPFKVEDVANLPKALAQTFITNGVAVEMKIESKTTTPVTTEYEEVKDKNGQVVGNLTLKDNSGQFEFSKPIPVKPSSFKWLTDNLDKQVTGAAAQGHPFIYDVKKDDQGNLTRIELVGLSDSLRQLFVKNVLWYIGTTTTV